MAMAIGTGSRAAADSGDDRRALVMLRVLAYDKNLAKRVGDEVRIAVAYAGGDEGTRWSSAFATAKKLKVDGRTVTVVPLKVDSAETLSRALQPMHAAALLVCDGLTRKISVAQLAGVTRPMHVLTLTTREAEVASGLAVGIVPGSSRDEIVINMRAVAAEGVKFDAGLLQLARAIKEKP